MSQTAAAGADPCPVQESVNRMGVLSATFLSIKPAPIPGMPLFGVFDGENRQ